MSPQLKPAPVVGGTPARLWRFDTRGQRVSSAQEPLELCPFCGLELSTKWQKHCPHSTCTPVQR